MLRARVIPALLLRNESLVKTVQFGKYEYIGDPANTVRIFNELEVDELCFLDITATPDRRGPNLKVLREISDECFMPLAYGGGIRTLDQAKDVFKLGFEKVVLNSHTHEDPSIVTRVAEHFGSQAVIASIDVKRDTFGRATVRTRAGQVNTKKDPVGWAQEMEARGAGEILLTSIDREGTWQGYDLPLIKEVAEAVSVPLIAHGGAGDIRDIGEVVRNGGASAAAVGSLVVFQKKGRGVLVNFPSPEKIRLALDGLLA